MLTNREKMIVLFAAVVVAVATMLTDRHAGVRSGELKAAHAETQQAIATRDSAIGVSRAAVARAARSDSIAKAARAPHEASIAATNVALGEAKTAREAAEHALADSAATLQDVRERLATLVKADARAEAQFAQERARAALRIAKLERAAFDDSVAIAKMQGSVDEAVRATDKALRELAAARAAVPGVGSRAVHGVVTAVAGGGCAAVGWTVAGPLGALGAGVTCAAIAGVVHH